MADKNPKGNKRSKAFYLRGRSVSKRMRRDTFLDVGMRGFILTCNHGEQPCVREAYCLLGEYADNLYGPENVGGEEDGHDGSENESDFDDIEASLQKEVAQMKQKQVLKETRFQSINSGAKNVAFMRTKLPDPTELVHYLLTDIAATQTCKSCHIIRMIPVNMTCRATMEDISKHAPDFLHPYFHADGVKPTTFAVKIKIRNNSVVKRDDVINSLASVVMVKGVQHIVNLDAPELALIVEIIKNVCCLSVVRDFNKLKKYNLHEIVGGGGLTKKNNPSRSAKNRAPGTKSGGRLETNENNKSEHLQEKAENREQLEEGNSELKATEGNEDCNVKESHCEVTELESETVENKSEKEADGLSNAR